LRRVRLGSTDLAISCLGLGTWAIGGPWAYGWGPQDDALSLATIERAVAAGINWIDTAPAYGLGHAEEIVARALSRLATADRPYLFTKCGLVWNERGQVSHDLSPASLAREVEASLRRLRVETIDLYQIHWPGMPGGGPEADLERAWETLAGLQRQGKLRFLGVSNFHERQLARVAAIAPVASLQPPYSLLRREIEAAILPWCAEHGVGVLAYSPMGAGLLSGTMTPERIAALADDDWRKRHRDFTAPRRAANLALVECLRAIGARHGRSAGEVAIAWTLAHPAVTAAIVGARRAEQVDGFRGAAELELDASDRAAIAAALAERERALGRR